MRSVHIVSTGVRCAAGLTSATSAAAVRAGVIRAGEHPVAIDCSGEPVSAAIDSALDPSLVGPERFIAMAVSAAREACAPLAPWPTIAVPVYLGLPQIRPGFSEHDAHDVVSRLSSPGALPVGVSSLQSYPHGHAAGLVALAHAKAAIDSGVASMCLVGGIDSYLHPETIRWLDQGRQLAGPRSRSGFVPGEGAGFCLLVDAQTLRTLRAPSLGAVRAVSIGNEPKTMKRDVIPLGEGLASTVGGAVRGLGGPGRRVNQILCDINGERYRGEEWGFVCLRLSQYFDDIADYRCPAGTWGDVGAASGPLLIALASQAALRGYDKGPLSLIWTSSEGGTRAALVLDSEATVPMSPPSRSR